MKHNILFYLLAGMFASALCPLLVAEVVTIRYERAASPDGPWEEVDSSELQVMPDGSATVQAVGDVFYRLRIAADGETGALPVVATRSLPSALIDRASRHMIEHAARDAESSRAGDDSEFWADAVIAPFACLIHRPGDREGGARIAELKLVRPQPRSGTRATFLTDYSSEDNAGNAGYMIVSLDRSDLPVLEFAMEGSTPGERLLQRSRGRAPARIVRYGPTFWDAEDADGNLVSNLGTEPFKIPHAFHAHMQESWEGDFDNLTGLREVPPALRMNLEEYATYGDFKEDMENSPVQRLLRERRAQHARWIWDIEEGISPRLYEVDVNETLTFLPGTDASRLVVHWEDTEEPLATAISPRVGGGIQITGHQPGSAPISYYANGAYQQAVVLVNSRAPSAASPPSGGSVVQTTTIKTWIAGSGWNDQMKYYQLKDDDWCDLVGCGPTAIAMLMGWWDHKGVPSAFYSNFGSSLATADAPRDLNSSANRAKIRPVYDELHELCDVICPWGSDAGATWPGDLIEGFYGYTFIPDIAGFINVSGSWAWDSWGDDWQVSGVKLANGIKKGRPGVVGLGTLWHYGVAYAYRRKETKIFVNGKQVVGSVNRYFKVNEGWKNNSPSWYSAYDIFLGLTANISQTKLP